MSRALGTCGVAGFAMCPETSLRRVVSMRGASKDKVAGSAKASGGQI